MHIIGLTGKAGSGKDTTAQIMMQIYGPEKCRIVSFADPLRRGISELFGLSPVHFSPEQKNTKIAAYGKSPREIMQHIGTDVLRMQYNKNIFIYRMIENVIHAINDGIELFIIPDVRFENEALLIHLLYGHIVKIINSDDDFIISDWQKHISEYNNIQHDAILRNQKNSGLILLRIKTLLVLGKFGLV